MFGNTERPLVVFFAASAAREFVDAGFSKDKNAVISSDSGTEHAIKKTYRSEAFPMEIEEGLRLTSQGSERSAITWRHVLQTFRETTYKLKKNCLASVCFSIVCFEVDVVPMQKRTTSVLHQKDIHVFYMSDISST